MRTPTTFRDHPLHPMLIVFPQGLWGFSLVCQIIAQFVTEPTTWLTVAYFTAGGGIIGALLAAIPGFIDLFSMNDRRAKNTGITHMVLNLTGVVIWAIIYYLLGPDRRLQNADLAMWLSLGVSVLLFYSGWLGGDMVHRYRVAVREEYEEARTPADRVRSDTRRT